MTLPEALLPVPATGKRSALRRSVSAKAGALAPANASARLNITMRIAVAAMDHPSHWAAASPPAINSLFLPRPRRRQLCMPQRATKSRNEGVGAGPDGDLALSALQRIWCLPRQEVVHD